MAKRWIFLDDKEIDMIDLWASLSDDKELATAIIKKLAKAQKRITVKSAKGKGRELQQWVCQKIADLTEIKYDQKDDQCQIHSREMGQAGVDVILRGYVEKWFPFSIECKSSESLGLRDAIEQAKANMGRDKSWIIFHRRKSIPGTMAIMDAEAFFAVVEANTSMLKLLFAEPVYLTINKKVD